MTTPVWLARIVATERDRPKGEIDFRPPSGWYAKPVALPIPPAAGLGVIVDSGCDPSEMEHVFVSENGGVVCVLPHHFHTQQDEDSGYPWAEALAYLTNGWQFLGDRWGHYKLPPAAP